MDEQDEEYQTQMRDELSHIPLGELKAMQDKLGLKAFNKMKTGLQAKSKVGATFKRLNKHRPAEFSARKPVPRQAVVIKEKTRRDPRFDDLSGEFDEAIFKKSYDFLDDIRSREKKELKKMMDETKNKSKKSQLKNLYNRLEQKEKSDKKKEQLKQMEQEWKKQEKEKVVEGKKPYFLKKSEKKVLIQEKHQKELAESGKLEKYTERKNKKIASLERKRQEWKTDV